MNEVVDNATRPVSHRSRLILAFCVSPFLPGFYGALLFAQPWALPYGIATAYPSAIVIGIPAVEIMHRRGWWHWWDFIAMGILCAIPALAIYAWMRDVPHIESFGFLNALIVLGWGAFAGACFWLLGAA